MRRVLVALAAVIAVAVVVVVAVVGVRTSRFEPPAAAAGTAAAVNVSAPNADTIAAHLAQAVRFKTISWSDTTPPDDEDFAAMRAWMGRTWPRVHQTLTPEIVAGNSLLYTWRGTDSSLAPVVLMAHMDVVPVEAGTEAKWEHPPFAGDIANGFVWGRGTMDDKANVVSELEAVEHLLASGFTPTRTVLLAFGHNEEVLGSGAKAIVTLLQSRGVRPAMVVDEGGAVAEGVFAGVTAPVAIIGTAEKGYQSVELIVDAAGGHSSMPPKETASGIVAAAVARLEQHPLPAHLTPLVSEMFDRMGRHMSGLPRMTFANLWLFRPLIMSRLQSAPQTNAMVRTTTAPTMLEGSPKDNVLPQRARAVVNFRLLPGDSIAGVLAYVRRTVDDARVIIRAVGPGSEPSSVSPTASAEFATLERTFHEVVPSAVTTPYLLVGGTDSRHYAPIARNIFRASAMGIRGNDLERVHGTNERSAIADLRRNVQFYVRLIQNVQSM